MEKDRQTDRYVCKYINININKKSMFGSKKRFLLKKSVLKGLAIGWEKCQND